MRIATSSAPIRRPKPPSIEDQLEAAVRKMLEPLVAQELAKAFEARGEPITLPVTEVAVEADLPADDYQYAITKSLDEERYTFGPLYTPDEIDAHREYTTATELTKAMRQFVASGSRQVNKQHRRGGNNTPIGTVVDAVVWPYPAEVELSVPGREVRKAALPAGTAYLGVVWTPEAWPGVKGGAITGYSLGGRAMRVHTGELLPPMKR